MFDDCLIMAGGSGTRLWPASTSSLPKQFLPAENKKSFFTLALERAFCIAQRVIVIAGSAHLPHVISCAASFSASEKKRIIVIVEPEAKNTAPAIFCSVVFSLLSGLDRTMIVLTSDHIIKPIKVFKSDAALAYSSAKKNNLVIFGIKPLRPETGFGYIETLKNKNISENEYDVAAFHEKPNSEKAEKYINSGNFFWNSGMFAFNADFIAGQYKNHSANIYNCFTKLKKPLKTEYSFSKGIRTLTSWKGLKAAYKKADKISFDYAITEKCKNVKMVKANFDWIDIGSWEDYLCVCGNNKSEVFYSDNENCYVNSDIPVAIAGVDDLIVVIKNGKNGSPACALITKKSQTHKVQDVIAKIKISGRSDLL